MAVHPPKGGCRGAPRRRHQMELCIHRKWMELHDELKADADYASGNGLWTHILAAVREEVVVQYKGMVPRR